MSECCICKGDKFHNKTFEQGICCIEKQKIQLLKCQKCECYYHHDCAFNQILTRKSEKHQNPYECPFKCGEYMELDVPYKNHDEYQKHYKFEHDSQTIPWIFFSFFVFYWLMSISFDSYAIHRSGPTCKCKLAMFSMFYCILAVMVVPFVVMATPKNRTVDKCRKNYEITNNINGKSGYYTNTHICGLNYQQFDPKNIKYIYSDNVQLTLVFIVAYAIKLTSIILFAMNYSGYIKLSLSSHEIMWLSFASTYSLVLIVFISIVSYYIGYLIYLILKECVDSRCCVKYIYECICDYRASLRENKPQNNKLPGNMIWDDTNMSYDTIKKQPELAK